MKVTRTPRTVHYILSPDKITSFAGLKLVADLAGKLGVLRGLEGCTVKKRRRGIPAPDFVMSLAYNFMAGGSHLSDLEELRSEAATREHLYDLAVAAPTTAGEYLAKFTTGHIKQLEGVIRETLRAGAEIAGDDSPVTLDLDSSSSRGLARRDSGHMRSSGCLRMAGGRALPGRRRLLRRNHPSLGEYMGTG